MEWFDIFSKNLNIASLFLFLIITLAIVIVGFIEGQKYSSANQHYQSKDFLFTAAERRFLCVLDQAVGCKARVFGQVRIADLMRVKKGLSNSDRQTAQNKINSKHLDFIVCDSEDLRVLFVIELNDKSHQQKRRIDRDNFVKSACDSAGIPLLWVKAKREYSLDEIRTLIDPYIDRTCLSAESNEPSTACMASSANGSGEPCTKRTLEQI